LAGDLESVNYSDSTPGYTNTYDRLGRITQQSSLNSQLSKTHNPAGLPVGETYSGGPLDGLSVINGYDQFLRRTNLTILRSGVPLDSQTFGYDAASRLQAMTDCTNTASNSYGLLLADVQAHSASTKANRTIQIRQKQL
jgi:hypothetical protein